MSLVLFIHSCKKGGFGAWMQINPHEWRVQFKIHAPEQPCTATGDLCSVLHAELLALTTQEKHLALRDHGDRKIGYAATQSLIMIKDMLYYFQKIWKAESPNFLHHP